VVLLYTLDIVIQNNNHVTIIDVCCPFENGEEALEEAVARKELKYLHLKTHFEAQNKSCDVFGFAIGAIGTWHTANERIISALGMSAATKISFANCAARMSFKGLRTSIANILGVMMSFLKYIVFMFSLSNSPFYHLTLIIFSD
jgi:hypothetical protein